MRSPSAGLSGDAASGGLTLRRRGGPLQTLLGRFAVTQTSVAPVGIRYNLAAAGYTIAQDLGNDRYWTIDFTGTLTIGGEFLRIRQTRLQRLLAQFVSGDAPVVFSGTWATSSYPGVDYRYTNVAGRYIEWTTDAGVTSVGCAGTELGTNGVAKVSIDGDPTLATGLPTAQDLVTAGTLANTVLVANGGTLNPTDRVWNQYNNTGVVSFNSNLTAGVHVVRMTVTGYKQAASAGANIGFWGFYAYGAGLYNLTAPHYLFETIQNIATIGNNPVWEISYYMQPTGALAREWLGHTGSLKHTVLPSVTVDGALQSMSIGDRRYGSTIALTMQFGVRHTEISAGAVNVGTLDLTYTMRAVTGLTITHTTVWSTSGDASGYPCMLLVDNAVFDRVRTLGTAPAVWTNNNDTVALNTRNNVMYTYDFDGNLGAVLYIPDMQTTVENWVYSTMTEQLYAWDPSASGGTWNKMYALRFTNPQAFVNGTTWQSEAQYRVQWFAAGAAAVLGL